LLTIDQYKYVFSELDKLPKLLHQLIKFTNDKLEF